MLLNIGRRHQVTAASANGLAGRIGLRVDSIGPMQTTRVRGTPTFDSPVAGCSRRPLREIAAGHWATVMRSDDVVRNGCSWSTADKPRRRAFRDATSKHILEESRRRKGRAGDPMLHRVLGLLAFPSIRSHDIYEQV